MRWIILAVATFTQAAAAFFAQGIGALGVHLQQDLGIGTAQLGLLTSAVQFVPLLGLLIAGELLDRFDERWVVGAGATIVGVALLTGVPLLTGTTGTGFPALLAVLLVVGAGYSTAQPGGSKSVAAWFDASRRGTAMGIRQAGLPLGAALASATLPAVGAVHGLPATLAVGGAVALTGAAAFVLLYRRPPAHPSAETAPPPPAGADEDAPPAAAGAGEDAPAAPPAGRSVPLAAGGPGAAGSRLALLRVPAARAALLCGVCLISVQVGIGLLTVLHLHEVAAMPAGRAALVLVLAQGAGVAGRIVLAMVSDRARTARQSVVTASLVAVLVALMLLLTPAGGEPVAAAVIFGWLGFFGIGWYGPWVALVTEAAPAGRTGFALGLAMSVNQVAIVAMPPLLGLLHDVTGGFTASWGLLAVLTGAALAYVGPGQVRKGHERAGSERAGRGKAGSGGDLRARPAASRT
ncbi:MFS transporter [Paractinoplanes ferrugineus]|uniref:MFS transporter n=1 Tax=Paractinoplanes ferrugineus TaxID=113564 RepID=A0A919J6S5_9ACTN|nr:MFS transporter [Actinoplanes ferrugineus]GIE14377.1 MFS transporter [Actinoplanes ferrugineus]